MCVCVCVRVCACVCVKIEIDQIKKGHPFMPNILFKGHTQAAQTFIKVFNKPGMTRLMNTCPIHIDRIEHLT